MRLDRRNNLSFGFPAYMVNLPPKGVGELLLDNLLYPALSLSYFTYERVLTDKFSIGAGIGLFSLNTKIKYYIFDFSNNNSIYTETFYSFFQPLSFGSSNSYTVNNIHIPSQRFGFEGRLNNGFTYSVSAGIALYLTHSYNSYNPQSDKYGPVKIMPLIETRIGYSF